MSDALSGAAAVVTGSSRGLGRAIALDLARAGAAVVVNGTDAQAVAGTANEIRRLGGQAAEVVGSVTSHALCQELVDRCVSEFGGIDVLVNNAGITRDRTLVKMTEDEFDAVVATHLRGTWSCSAAAARAMKDGGSIVNVTSGAGLFGTFGQSNYAAAKAGIVGLSRVMDLELAPRGIRVNVLSPVAATAMTAVFAAGDVGHREAFPPAESVAPIVTFLAGPAAAHLHGQVLSFDGSRLSVWSHPEAATSVERDVPWQAQDFAAALTSDVQQPYHADRWGAGITSR